MLEVFLKIPAHEGDREDVVVERDGNGLQEVILVIEFGKIQHLGEMTAGIETFLRPELLQEELLTGKGFAEGQAEAVEGCRGAGMGPVVRFVNNDGPFYQ